MNEFDISRLVRAEGTASVAHAPGAVRLDGYPLLVYGRDRRGTLAVRTEDRGIPAADIVAAASTTPDHDALAARFGTTAAHVAEAIRHGAR